MNENEVDFYNGQRTSTEMEQALSNALKIGSTYGLTVTNEVLELTFTQEG